MTVLDDDYEYFCHSLFLWGNLCTYDYVHIRLYYVNVFTDNHIMLITCYSMVGIITAVFFI